MVHQPTLIDVTTAPIGGAVGIQTQLTMYCVGFTRHLSRLSEISGGELRKELLPSRNDAKVRNSLLVNT